MRGVEFSRTGSLMKLPLSTRNIKNLDEANSAQEGWLRGSPAYQEGASMRFRPLGLWDLSLKIQFFSIVLRRWAAPGDSW